MSKDWREDSDFQVPEAFEGNFEDYRHRLIEFEIEGSSMIQWLFVVFICAEYGRIGIGLSMFGTSNSGTDVTSAPSCGLRHQILNSAPNSVEILTLAPWKIRVPKLITFAEVYDLCRSSFTRSGFGLKNG